MAHAGIYYFESGTYCYICHKPSNQTRKFASRVQELDDPNIMIPLHAGCYWKKITRFCTVGALAFILTIGILSIAESYFFFHSFSPFAKLPTWLTVVNIIVALFPAVYFGFKSYFKYWREINDYIQVHTYPVY
jgi:hypothetical protein